MTILHLKAGPAMLTNAGKHHIAIAMFHRGEQFLGSAILLKNQGGNGYVWRHLLCQGAELIMKGCLLLFDYNYYKPKLKKFGHKLLKLCDHCVEVFNLSPITGEFRDQIAIVSDLYENHELRYASGMDILIRPETIRVEMFLHRLSAACVVFHRTLKRDT
jgi:hypothetical protein